MYRKSARELARVRFIYAHAYIYTYIYIYIYIYIYVSVDCKPPCDVRGIFLDVSKVFERVWHEGLTIK